MAGFSRPLQALGLLLLISLLGVLAVRSLGISPQQREDAPTLSLRQLRFEDLADGGIAVRDARSGALLETVAPGSNGFLRSAMRGLVRERKRQQMDASQAFELHSRADGRLTLLDPATQRRIDLESFGSANLAVFARLVAPLQSPGSAP